jgi:DNA mismatch repair protein MutL
VKIKKLDKNLINKIAAGEVVERPASVVKELIENSIDADATSIILEITGGGDRLIRIIDNGSGMEKDDLRLAFERYATSKISTIEDLFKINSLGFRGEALPSIASVSDIDIYSKVAKNKEGYYLKLEKGNIIEEYQRGGPTGTNITIKNLFANIPVRKKFLKSENAEYLEIMNVVKNFVLFYPTIQFRLLHNGKEIKTYVSAPIINRFIMLYKDVKKEELIEINYEKDGFKISGIISRPFAYRKNKSRIYISVNGRFLKDFKLIYYFTAPYGQFLMKGQFPEGVLEIKMEPEFLDVNVHPRKTEVKFLSPSTVRNNVFEAIFNGLQSNTDAFSYNSGNDEEVKIEQIELNIKKRGKQGNFEFTKSEKGEYSASLSGRISEHNEIKFRDKDYIYIGTLFQTYILLKSESKMLLIDQHAADERVIFEKIEEDINEKIKLSQELLFPIELQFSLENHQLEFLEDIGFAIKENKIEAIPTWLNMRHTKEEIDRILCDLVKEKYDFMDWIKQLACKSAVKGGQKLPFKLIKEIIESLSKCKNPYQCPHGRPTVIEWTKGNIEKLFKRK